MTNILRGPSAQVSAFPFVWLEYTKDKIKQHILFLKWKKYIYVFVVQKRNMLCNTF